MPDVKTLTLDELKVIEDNMILRGIDDLLADLRKVNASDRSFEVRSGQPDTLLLANRHGKVANKIMQTIEAKTVASFSS